MRLGTTIVLMAAPLVFAACGGSSAHRPTSSTAASGTLYMKTIPNAPRSDDPAGVALLQRVIRAYRPVRAVVLQVGPLRTVEVLRNGRIVADWIVLSEGPRNSERWLTPGPGATYIRIGTSACWRRLRAGNPLARTSVGRPLFDRSRMRVLKPVRERFGWLLPTLDGPPGAYTSRHTYFVDGRSFIVRVASYTVAIPARARAAGMRSVIAQAWRVLATAPKLPVPRPACVR